MRRVSTRIESNWNATGENPEEALKRRRRRRAKAMRCSTYTCVRILAAWVVDVCTPDFPEGERQHLLERLRLLLLSCQLEVILVKWIIAIAKEVEVYLSRQMLFLASERSTFCVFVCEGECEHAIAN